MIIHDVAQRSPEWYTLRAGLPTASEFSKIVTSKGEPSKSAATYAITLAAELFAGKPLETWEGNAWTDRGRELELAALALYEFVTGAIVEPVGFVTTDDGMAGCSPDGFVGDDGLVEVKCLKGENHVKAILYFQKNGQCPPDYVQQAQGQMLVCARPWCDLVFYHPELPPLTIRQERNTDLQAAIMTQIPLLIAERDVVVAALRRQSTPSKE